ncbi:MAG: GNAT family N-acetyltransferase [Geminicoccaceae bacterium]|nr:GNAT family N-acetyltransferase [Geminicoccaceae bacterium]
MSPAAYRVSVATAWPAEGLAGLGLRAPTVFQNDRWLGAWYAALGSQGGATPLVVRAEREGGGTALVLPLVRRSGRPWPVVEFADAGVTDYNAPLLGPSAPSTAAEAAVLWRAVRGALRRAAPGAAVAHLVKMPLDLGGRPNPLALLGNTTPANVFGNVLTIGDDFAAWRRQGLTRHVRKELERAWRVFAAHAPDAAFHRVTDPTEARSVYRDLAEMQRRRIAEAGLPYLLDRPAYDAFYRSLVEAGLDDGSTMLTVLCAGGGTIAAMFGIADGRSYAMLRIGDAGGAWRAASPGRLLIEKTMAHLHGEGYRTFDFTIGDYAHKRRFNVDRVPLVDLTLTLNPLGLPRLGYDRLKAFVKARPGLAAPTRTLIQAVRQAVRPAEPAT